MSSAASPSLDSSLSPFLSRLVTAPPSASGAADSARLCSELESGNILYFPHTPFSFPAEEREFLLGLEQSDATLHKNVSYRPAEDRVGGLAKADPARMEMLRSVLRNYSRRASLFLEGLLIPYRGHSRLDLASFRPLEERGRPARLHARNDLPQDRKSVV